MAAATQDLVKEMRVVSGIENLPNEGLRDTVVTIGVFDGVHVGHQKVIRHLSEIRKTEGVSASVLFTFERHPLSVTHPEMVPPLLTTHGEKMSLLKQLDIDIIVVEKFTSEIADTHYSSFISNVLIDGLGMKYLVVGYDFHMGRGREGSQQMLCGEGKRLGFGCTIVPPVVLHGSVISSTKIRRAVFERRLRQAARFLGRSYFFDAEVVAGEGIGRTIAFPTANVEVPSADKLMPPEGVYAVRVEVCGTTYDGMMNIGEAPTLHAGGGRRIEIHLFDFSGNVYGERLRVHCIDYVRKEKVFASPQALKAQLAEDRETVTNILENILEKRH